MRLRHGTVTTVAVIRELMLYFAGAWKVVGLINLRERPETVLTFTHTHMGMDDGVGSHNFSSLHHVSVTYTASSVFPVHHILLHPQPLPPAGGAYTGGIKSKQPLFPLSLSFIPTQQLCLRWVISEKYQVNPRMDH